jgi:[protein-PII] uridylyltransferase
LTGPALRRALTEAAEGWLRELLGDPGPGIALVVLGAYGRREPAPGSDLDLVLVHDGSRKDVADVANSLWYPIWDAQIPLDHSVRTIDEAVHVADQDLRAALGLLDARHVAGDADLAAALRERLLQRWRATAHKRLPQLRAAGEERAREHGEVAFLLEPDLKVSRGGLRDVEALRALAAAWVADVPGGQVAEAHTLLMDARGELHKRTRGRDKLLLQEQEGVARALDLSDSETLAYALADAGRTIAWAWDSAWHRVSRNAQPSRWRSRGRRPVRRPLDDGVVEQDGEVMLARDVEVGADPVLVLRAAGAAARAGLPLSPYTLERLVREAPPMPVPWPHAARDALVSLLAAGPSAVPVWESLDQVGLLVRLLPDWRRVRSKPQRNPYHRFTVDRHLIEAATNAAALTRNVDRPDLLLLGALLHDIGKGLPGDHTEQGIEVVRRLAPQLSLTAQDTEVLVALVRHHLLLPEVATRRDLSDPATATAVAEAVGSREVLLLLQALTEADSLATGPTAWGTWKKRLIGELVSRTWDVLEGRPPAAPPQFGPQQERLLEADGTVVEVRPGDSDLIEVAIATADRPGLFATAAGVLALHRLDVRRASAGGQAGRALTEFTVATPHGRRPDPDRLRTDLLAALEGKLPVADRLADRQRSTRPSRGPAPAPPAVTFDDASEGSTIVEVRAPDGVGVLYAIANALTAAGLDVVTAIIASIGADVVDAFYVQANTGLGLLSAERRTAIASAVLTALEHDPAVPHISPGQPQGER